MLTRLLNGSYIDLSHVASIVPAPAVPDYNIGPRVVIRHCNPNHKPSTAYLQMEDSTGYQVEVVDCPHPHAYADELAALANQAKAAA